MKFIEQFNNQVNSSRIYTPDSIVFQDQVNLLLKTFFEHLDNHEKAIVIGAGNLSDISLSGFLRVFNSITLSDIDELSMKRALSFQRLSKQDYKKIIVSKDEYTGFEDTQLFSLFKERFVNCLSKEKIDQVVTQIFNEVKNYQFLSEDFNTYDFVYVSPIYTQLVYQQSLLKINQLEASGYPKHLAQYLKERILQEMPKIIDRFNDNLINLLTDKGAIAVLSDIFELNHNSGFYRRVKNSIKNRDVMEEIYNGYKEKYGMGLGDYGLYNLDDKLTPFISRWLIWPKDENSSYIVKLKIYNNKGGKL